MGPECFAPVICKKNQARVPDFLAMRFQKASARVDVMFFPSMHKVQAVITPLETAAGNNLLHKVQAGRKQPAAHA